MTAHTKGPLTMFKRGMGVIKGGPLHEFNKGSSQSQLFLAMAGREMTHQERDANAEHVVKCWNLHYELVDVLRALRKEATHDEEHSGLTWPEFDALRPTEGSGSAGALAAVERHLGDMRAIAFHKLSIPVDKQGKA